MKSRNSNIKIKFKKTGTLSTILATVIFVAIAAVCIKLGATSVFATKGDSIYTFTNQKQALVQENKKLETEIAQYQSISRIGKEAKDKLGMVKSDKVTYIDGFKK